MPHTQDKCELEIAAADCVLTKEFIVKLLPVLVPRQHWGSLAGKSTVSRHSFPNPPEAEMPLLSWPQVLRDFFINKLHAVLFMIIQTDFLLIYLVS